MNVVQPKKEVKAQANKEGISRSIAMPCTHSATAIVSPHLVGQFIGMFAQVESSAMLPAGTLRRQ
jgi:hypothetical protein